jgi:hypothetical protein
MRGPAAPSRSMELPAISLVVAIAVALMALCAAFHDPQPDSVPPRPGPCGEAARVRAYSPPAAAITLVSRRASALESGIGDEQAPFAQRYEAG